MRRVKLFLIALATLLLFTACKETRPTLTQSVYLVIKTPHYRASGSGFVTIKQDEVTIEIYSAATAVMRLRATPTQVCSDAYGCLSVAQFQEHFYAHRYPGAVLFALLRGMPLFGKKISVKGHDFTQRLQKRGSYAIVYRISKKEKFFRDTMNGILIKVKAL